MRSLLALCLVGTLLSANLRAADSVLLSVVSTAAGVAAGQPAAVEVAALNRGPVATSFQAPPVLHGLLTMGDRTWPVELHADRPAEAAPSAPVVPAGSFALVRYVFTVPTDANGQGVMQLDLPGQSVRVVLDVTGAGAAPSVAAAPAEQAGGAGSPTAPGGGLADAPSQLARPRTAASVFDRTFATRLGPHEPVYFIYGDKTPAAKFQFSFKYRLLDLTAGQNPKMERTLQFAFTQRSLWDINASSSPFFDTSYMPEVMFESLTYRPESDNRWFTWLGYQAAFKHESNGRDGPVSRSLNTVYFRPVFALGDIDHWYAIVAPEVFGYLGGLSDNPRLQDYRGFGQLRMVLGRNNGPALMVTAMAGRDHGSMQFDLTVPIRTKLLDFETYLLIQYFNGYGESLLYYREKSEAVRAGFSLVR